MTQLLGNSDTSLLDHTTEFELFNTDMVAALHTATASGTVEEIHFYLRADAISDAVSVDMGIYADASGAPGALLGRTSVAVGTVTGPLWITATGLSVPVINGHDYWLAVMPTGGSGVLFYDAASAVEAGSPLAYDNSDTHTQLPDPYTPTPSPDSSGPLGLYASGTVATAAVPTHAEPELRFQVTTLRYPTIDAVVLCELEQFTDGEVGIPINEGRDGQVTISVYDDAYAKLAAQYDGSVDEYAAMLRVFYDGVCVLWAPITGAPFKGDAGTVTLVASDKTRLENHEVVIGDEAISPANPYGGRIPVDYRGLRLLRDAAINLPGQTLRGVPDIGIADGTNDQPDNDVFITIQRGTEVWSAWTDLVSHGPTPGHDGAPDFELEPRTDLPGAYCQLNTYSHQGSDKTASIVLHYGFGRDNLAGFDSDPLGKIITHQHALGRNNKIRETRADLASSAYRGLYVKWDALDYGGSDADLRIALGAWAKQQVDAYSIPVHVVKVTLKPEPEITDQRARYRYLRDFTVGDEIHAQARKGHHRETAEGRIVKVTLKQRDQGRIAIADIDVVPNVAGDGSGTEDD